MYNFNKESASELLRYWLVGEVTGDLVASRYRGVDPEADAVWQRVYRALDGMLEVGDRVDDVFIDEETGTGRLCLFVTLNKGNVGEGAIQEVIPIWPSEADLIEEAKRLRAIMDGATVEPKAETKAKTADRGPFKAKPALYRFPELPWAWVRLEEMAEIVGQTPAEVWANFFALTKDIDKGVLPIATWEFNEARPEILHIGPNGSGVDFRYDFVPAGWAMDVLEAAEAGVVRVVEQFHEHLDDLDECPPGTLNCTFNGSGFVAAVGLDVEGNPVETGAGEAPRSEAGCCHGCLAAGRILEGHFVCSWPSEEAISAIESGEAGLRLYDRRGWQVVWH